MGGGGGGGQFGFISFIATCVATCLVLQSVQSDRLEAQSNGGSSQGAQMFYVNRYKSSQLPKCKGVTCFFG